MTFFSPTLNRLVNKPEKKQYLDPISLSLMKDPVLIESGMTFERSTILEWFQSHDSCPITRIKCSHRNVHPNMFAKKEINEYLDKYLAKSFKSIEKHLNNRTCIKDCGILIEKCESLLHQDANKNVTNSSTSSGVVINGRINRKVEKRWFDIQTYKLRWCLLNMEDECETEKLKKNTWKNNGRKNQKFIFDDICQIIADTFRFSPSTALGILQKHIVDHKGKQFKRIYLMLAIHVLQTMITGHDKKKIFDLSTIPKTSRGELLLTLIALYSRDLSIITHLHLFQIEEISKTFISSSKNKIYLKLLTQLLPLQQKLFGHSSEMLNRYIHLAKLYRSINETQKAIDIYTAAVSSRHKKLESSKYYRKRLSVVYNNRAILYDDYSMELRDLNESIKLYPTYKKYCNRGVCYENMGEMGLALNDYCRSLSICREYERALDLRSNLYLKMGRNELAKRDFEILKMYKDH